MGPLCCCGRPKKGVVSEWGGPKKGGVSICDRVTSVCDPSYVMS